METTGKVFQLLLRSRDQEVVAKALVAACQPFGSLTRAEGMVDTEGLVDLLLRFVEGDAKVAVTILEMLFGAATDYSAVKFSGWNVVELITPTSGTVISVGLYEREFVVTVNFGPEGSTSRATEIRRADDEVYWSEY